MKKINVIFSFFIIIKIVIASEIITADNQTQYTSTQNYLTLSNLYQDIKSSQSDLNKNINNIIVKRDKNANIITMEWALNSNANISKKRDFTYDENNLLKKIISTENNILIETTTMGKNEISEKFFNYIFSPAFNPRDYNHFTKTIFNNNLPIEHQIYTMNNKVIGKIIKKYDQNSNLIYEVWYRGQSNSILREFRIKFNQYSKQSELVEVDEHGKIIKNQISSIY